MADLKRFLSKAIFRYMAERELARSMSELRELTDPLAMRALAHPTRLALLEALADAGSLTATQASDVVGESPASCSFHLRQLQKYGFVEEAGGGTGRQRPWKLAHVGMRFPDVQEDPEVAMAAVGLQSVLTPALPRAPRSRHGGPRPPPEEVARGHRRQPVPALHQARRAARARRGALHAAHAVPGPHRRPGQAAEGLTAGRDAPALLSAGRLSRAPAAGDARRAPVLRGPDPVAVRRHGAVAGDGRVGQAAHRLQQRRGARVPRLHAPAARRAAVGLAGRPGPAPDAVAVRQPRDRGGCASARAGPRRGRRVADLRRDGPLRRLGDAHQLRPVGAAGDDAARRAALARQRAASDRARGPAPGRAADRRRAVRAAGRGRGGDPRRRHLPGRERGARRRCACASPRPPRPSAI